MSEQNSLHYEKYHAKRSVEAIMVMLDLQIGGLIEAGIFN
jgi:hypothetical protein